MGPTNEEFHKMYVTISRLEHDITELQTRLDNISKHLHDVIYTVDGPMGSIINDLERLHKKELDLQYTVEKLSSSGFLVY